MKQVMIDNTSSRPRRTTRKQIAELAKVSPTTVTHVLQDNPQTRVSPETRERVLRIAKEHNYVPHALASTLRRQTGKHLALMINKPETVDPTISPLLAACREEAQKFGYYLMIQELGERNAVDAGELAFRLYQSGRVGICHNRSQGRRPHRGKSYFSAGSPANWGADINAGKYPRWMAPLPCRILLVRH